MLRTCVSPEGNFEYGIHKPRFTTENLRERTTLSSLGRNEAGKTISNAVNFPDGALEENHADWIFEIPNPFPFRGTTFINRRWAEEKANHPEQIRLPKRIQVSLFKTIQSEKEDAALDDDAYASYLNNLPEPLLLALASTSTDTRDLTALAKLCCEFVFEDQSEFPSGMVFSEAGKKGFRPVIHHRQLFEVLANNPCLPDAYKEVMVLRPGIQGSSEIVGEWLPDPDSHIFEYFRRNSYIPWGHFAANMANDAVRYRIEDLSFKDMRGLRHLYYQRTFARLAVQLQIGRSFQQKGLSEQELESLRRDLVEKIDSGSGNDALSFDRTLWGWNFGFDYAPSHYRLHASHQQIHQQYAMIPSSIPSWSAGIDDTQSTGSLKAYACGDLIESFIRSYRRETGQAFFDAYIKALETNRRMDGRDHKPQDLIVFDEDEVIVFVPKAQTSQWELQLMTRKPVGNILEADARIRLAIDRALFVAVNVLSALGAEMITSIEFSKRFDASDRDQHLLYCLLPRLPESPGAFSEAQLRWINGHYPEDFAAACKATLPAILDRLD